MGTQLNQRKGGLLGGGKGAIGTYGARDDRDVVDGSCGLLLQQLLNDEAADIASAYNCELPEARHDTEMLCELNKLVVRSKGGYLFGEPPLC